MQTEEAETCKKYSRHQQRLLAGKEPQRTNNRKRQREQNSHRLESVLIKGARKRQATDGAPDLEY
ncbi:hypothetical protein D3C86_1956400 [compost metagenome]